MGNPYLLYINSLGHPLKEVLTILLWLRIERQLDLKGKTVVYICGLHLGGFGPHLQVFPCGFVLRDHSWKFQGKVLFFCLVVPGGTQG